MRTEITIYSLVSTNLRVSNGYITHKEDHSLFTIYFIHKAHHFIFYEGFHPTFGSVDKKRRKCWLERNCDWSMFARSGVVNKGGACRSDTGDCILGNHLLELFRLKRGDKKSDINNAINRIQRITPILCIVRNTLNIFFLGGY